MSRLRRGMLALGLMVVYGGLVTPYRWLMRRRGIEPLAFRMGQSFATYWMPQILDSRDKTVYLKMGAAGSGNLRLLMAEYRDLVRGSPLKGKRWILAVLVLFRGWAASPEETELRSDLYVMY